MFRFGAIGAVGVAGAAGGVAAGWAATHGTEDDPARMERTASETSVPGFSFDPPRAAARRSITGRIFSHTCHEPATKDESPGGRRNLPRLLQAQGVNRARELGQVLRIAVYDLGGALPDFGGLVVHLDQRRPRVMGSDVRRQLEVMHRLTQLILCGDGRSALEQL